jgi:hypothetical protein
MDSDNEPARPLALEVLSNAPAHVDLRLGDGFLKGGAGTPQGRVQFAAWTESSRHSIRFSRHVS